MPATPPFGIGMFGVRFVRHDFQETLVSRHATHIFGRPGPRPIDAAPVLGCDIEGPEFLDYDRMAPAIAEVIEITEDGTLFEVAKTDVSGAEDTRVVVKGIFGQQLHIAVAQSTDPKLVKVVIPPIESRLDGKMQLFEVPVRRQNQPTPDLRLDLIQRNVDLRCVDSFEHAVNEQADQKRSSQSHWPICRKRHVEKPHGVLTQPGERRFPQKMKNMENMAKLDYMETVPETKP